MAAASLTVGSTQGLPGCAHDSRQLIPITMPSRTAGARCADGNVDARRKTDYLCPLNIDQGRVLTLAEKLTTCVR